MFSLLSPNNFLIVVDRILITKNTMTFSVFFTLN
jgi:hypothetical protein